MSRYDRSFMSLNTITARSSGSNSRSAAWRVFFPVPRPRVPRRAAGQGLERGLLVMLLPREEVEETVFQNPRLFSERTRFFQVLTVMR